MPRISSETRRLDLGDLSNTNKITILNEFLTKSPINSNNINSNNNSSDDSNELASMQTMNGGCATMMNASNFNKFRSRFPRLQECAHFHYEVNTVELPKNFKVIILDGDEHQSSKLLHNVTLNDSTHTQDVQQLLFQVQVTSQEKRWIVCRTFENFNYLDKHLHDCIYDRKFSCLQDLSKIVVQNQMLSNKDNIKNCKKLFGAYLSRLCDIVFTNIINCGPILNWFEIDNKGNRLFAIDDSPINIPAVAAAVVKKRYVAQSLDELSLDVGNMISVIDMPPSEETMWWRGKKELEVGFFPNECVELIRSNEQLSGNVTDHLPKITQSVRLKHGKLITLLRSFFNNRPARTNLQLRGIIKQRVFGCDLGEHLSNTNRDVPEILKICTKFIEKYGMVDGIYRHTGLQSNIQKLRNTFDEEKFSEIEQECYINDVHSVSSLLKMYFRELPNPLLTYQLYQKFISSVNVENKIVEIHDVVQQLPPPHYRTLVFLMRHLHELAKCSPQTSMNTKNLAIVWAPNLLKSREMDTPGAMQYDMLYSITLQANIAEFLIANADTIFDDKFSSLNRLKDGSLLVSSVKTHRPISVCNTAATKLISLEEAQDKYKQVGPTDIPKYHTVINVNPVSKKKQEKEKKKRSKKNVDAPKAHQQPQQEQNQRSPTDSMSSSMFSTKSHQASPSLSTKSFMRSLRSGSVKLGGTQQVSQEIHESVAHSLPIINRQQQQPNLMPLVPAPVIPLLSQSITSETSNTTTHIRPSQSHFQVSSNTSNQQQQTQPNMSEFSGSFMMNARLRSSSNLLKQQQQQQKSSPIPPPRQSIQPQAQQQQQKQPEELFYFGTDIKKDDCNMGSPILSTFKDFNSDLRKGEITNNLNRSNSARIFNQQSHLIRSKTNPNRNSNNEFKRLPTFDLPSTSPPSPPPLPSLAQNQEIEQFQEEPTLESPHLQQVSQLAQINELPNNLKLSSSSLSSTTSSTSSSSSSSSSTLSTQLKQPHNPLVINEDDLNSYDNEIYLNNRSLVEQLNRDNKELNILQSNDLLNRESLGFEYNPLLSADDDSQQQTHMSTLSTSHYDTELAKLNSEINKLLIEHAPVQQQEASTREQSLEDLSEPIIESIVEPFEPNLISIDPPSTLPTQLSPLAQLQANTLVHGSTTDDCTYCKISQQLKKLNFNKENQEKKHASDGCVYCRLKSSDQSPVKRDGLLLTKRPVSIGECLTHTHTSNKQQEPRQSETNFTKSTSNEELFKTALKYKENILRSKSIANDTESPAATVIDTQTTTCVMLNQEFTQNKRKLSMNFDEIKRRKAHDTTEHQYKSLQDNSSNSSATTSVKTKIKMMEQLKSVSNANIIQCDEELLVKPPQVQIATSKPITIKIVTPPEVVPRATVVQVLNPKTSLTNNNVIIVDSSKTHDTTIQSVTSPVVQVTSPKKVNEKRQTVKELLSKFETTTTK